MKLATLFLVFVVWLCLLTMLLRWMVGKDILYEEPQLPQQRQTQVYVAKRQKLEEKADHILVLKSARLMHLMQGERVIKTYSIALGPNPEGHKTKEGDGCTPEGIYQIDSRNPESVCYLALHISYPNGKDCARAAALNLDPGKDIMIHGLPNAWGDVNYMPRQDWTLGCIAVNNDEMYEIWHAVDDGTWVEIRP